MKHKLPKMDPDLETLVRSLMVEDEMIDHWSTFPEGHHAEVSVTLISTSWYLMIAPIIEKFGHGGSGRQLTFKRQDGQWVKVGDGFWVS